MIPKELEGILSSNPEILGGTICFKGTRVPVATFFDYIGSGYSLERFLRGYSSVQRDQALSVLQWQNRQSHQDIGLELVS